MESETILHKTMINMCDSGRILYVNFLRQPLEGLGPIYNEYKRHIDQCNKCRYAVRGDESEKGE